LGRVHEEAMEGLVSLRYAYLKELTKPEKRIVKEKATSSICTFISLQSKLY
jgi:hypothetical protein